jgi:phenylacetate-CoA ligase
VLHRIVWNYLDTLRSHRLGKRELAELQSRRLRTIVRHAYQTVPFYHDMVSRRGVRPDQIEGPERLRLLPALTRQDIQDNYPGRILATGTSTRGTIIRHTSGTTGEPLTVVWDNEYCDMISATRMVIVHILGVSLLDKTVEILYYGPESGMPRARPAGSRVRKVLAGPFLPPTLFTLRSRKMGFHRSIAELEDELAGFRPVAINTRPSYLRRLGLLLNEHGKTLQVRKTLVGGEFVSGSMRKELEDLFDSEVFTALGAQELGALGMECSEHSGMHLFADHFVFEFLRDGEPASAGEDAELIVTSLHNKTMPLIRYKLGDVVVPEPDTNCACGLNLPKLREVKGRPEDGLELPDGTRIPAGPVLDYIESLGLRDYQLVQTGKDSIIVKLLPNQDTRQTEQRLVSYLRSLFGDDVQIRLEEWKGDDIPPKYRPALRRYPAS